MNEAIHRSRLGLRASRRAILVAHSARATWNRLRSAYDPFAGRAFGGCPSGWRLEKARVAAGEGVYFKSGTVRSRPM